MSVSSAIEMAVSKGMEFTISIRKFKKSNGYSNKADFKMDITVLLDGSYGVPRFVTFDGDFNGDGRKDLVVNRSPAQCDIYLSSAASGFYDRQPQLQLEVPVEGRMVIEDLNQDGLSDIYVIDRAKGQIDVFLSNGQNKKGSLR
jgi:hypothetical protein